MAEVNTDARAKGFAAEYPIDPETKWILFPRDATLRREYYPPEVFDHPAKANIFLVQAITDYISKPGDTILDPFGGTGTQLMAAWQGRNVVLIEIEEQFQEMIKGVMDNWSKRDPAPTGQMMLFAGDNRQVVQKLDFLCDCAIFSPPYSTALAGSGQGFAARDEDPDKGEKGKYSATMAKSYGKNQLSEYSGKAANALNMGRLNPFYFAQAMDTLYGRIAKRLVPGGKMAVIVKDFMQGPKRVMISEQTIKQALRNGFTLEEWFKWKPPGSGMQAIARSKGYNVVLDEDIIIFRRKE